VAPMRQQQEPFARMLSQPANLLSPRLEARATRLEQQAAELCSIAERLSEQARSLHRSATTSADQSLGAPGLPEDATHQAHAEAGTAYANTSSTGDSRTRRTRRHEPPNRPAAGHHRRNSCQSRRTTARPARAPEPRSARRLGRGAPRIMAGSDQARDAHRAGLTRAGYPPPSVAQHQVRVGFGPRESCGCTAPWHRPRSRQTGDRLQCLDISRPRAQSSIG
jgi:hypothetical protein